MFQKYTPRKFLIKRCKHNFLCRFQAIQRLKRGEPLNHPDVYLQRWYLQHELKKHADDYSLHTPTHKYNPTSSHSPPPSKRIKNIKNNIKRNKTMFGKNAHSPHLMKITKNCDTAGKHDFQRIFVTATPTAAIPLC